MKKLHTLRLSSFFRLDEDFLCQALQLPHLRRLHLEDYTTLLSIAAWTPPLGRVQEWQKSYKTANLPSLGARFFDRAGRTGLEDLVIRGKTPPMKAGWVQPLQEATRLERFEVHSDVFATDSQDVKDMLAGLPNAAPIYGMWVEAGRVGFPFREGDKLRIAGRVGDFTLGMRIGFTPDESWRPAMEKLLASVKEPSLLVVSKDHAPYGSPDAGKTPSLREFEFVAPYLGRPEFCGLIVDSNSAANPLTANELERIAEMLAPLSNIRHLAIRSAYDDPLDLLQLGANKNLRTLELLVHEPPPEAFWKGLLELPQDLQLALRFTNKELWGGKAGWHVSTHYKSEDFATIPFPDLAEHFKFVRLSGFTKWYDPRGPESDHVPARLGPVRATLCRWLDDIDSTKWIAHGIRSPAVPPGERE